MMRSCDRLRGAIVSCLSLLVPIVAIGAENAAVQVESQMGGNTCFIAISNPSASTLKNIRVTLFNSDAPKITVGPLDLSMGQFAVLEHHMRTKGLCKGPGVFFKVGFEREGVLNEMLVPSALGASSAAAPSALTNQILGALLSVIPLILGGFMGHWLSMSREREKDRMAFRTKQFAETAPAVRRFLAEWNEAPVAKTLETHFRQLRQEVILSERVVELYGRTRDVLADDNMGVAEKKAAAREMSRQLAVAMRGFEPDRNAEQVGV